LVLAFFDSSLLRRSFPAIHWSTERKPVGGYGEICVHPRNPRGKSELSPVIWFDPWPVTPEPRRRRVNSLSARARRRFVRTAARHAAGPRPGTVLRRRSLA